MLETGAINRRGRVQTAEKCPEFGDRLTEENGERMFRLAGEVSICQTDIREVQLAKGAIAAGIQMLAERLGLEIQDIRTVLLAGAFGSFINPDSACAINLIPDALRGRIRAVGNAAGSGAKMTACSSSELARAGALIPRIEFLELASLPDFQHNFVTWMGF